MTIQGQKIVLSGDAVGTEVEALAKKSDVDAKAPLASPAFTGTPTVPTAAPGNNTTQAASTAFVQAAISGGAGGALPLAGGTMTGAIQGAVGAAATPSLTVGDVGSGFYRTGANAVGMALAGVNVFTFQATGLTFVGPASASLQVRSPGITTISAHRISSNANAPTNNLDKSRGAVGAETVVANGDVAGTFQMRAHNGSALVAVGSFSAEVRQATPSPTEMGSRLIWNFVRSGAASITEGMRLDSTGGLQMGGANTVIDDSRHFRLRSYTNATKPSASPAGQLIYISDVESGKLAQSNGSAWVIMGANPAPGDFVAKAGDTMTGALILNADPAVALGAATKQMVDAKVSAASPALTGTPTAPTAAAGTSTTQIATTEFITAALGDYLLKAGGTLTGALTLAGSPGSDMQAANKKYVDDQDAALDALRMPKVGGTFTGGVTFDDNAIFNDEVIINVTPTFGVHAANKDYVDTNFAPKASPVFTGTPTGPTAADGTSTGQLATTQFVQNAIGSGAGVFLPLSGGAMTGMLSLAGGPATGLHAANKTYVDNGDFLNMPKTGGAFTGFVTVHAFPAVGNQVANKGYVDAGDALLFPKTGGTITGAVDVEGNLDIDRDGDAIASILFLSGDVGTEQAVRMRKDGILRWAFGAGVAGNWSISRYDVAGVLQDTPWVINGATGIINFTQNPTAPTPATSDNSLKLATTAYVKAQPGATLASKPEAAAGVEATKVITSELARVAGVVTSRGNRTFSEIDGVGSAPLGWTQTGITVTSGGIYGAQRLQAVVTTAGGIKTAVEEHFIPVDENRLYCLKARGFNISGNPIFGVGLECYDANKTLILTRYPAAIGQGISLGGSRIFSGIIIGSGSGHNNFPAGTRYVKRIWHVSGDGTAALDFTELQEVQPTNFLTADQLGFIPGQHGDWNAEAFSDIFDWLISEGGTIFIPAGTYDITAGIQKTTPSAIGYKLFGDGVRTRIRRASAWWSDFIEVYGDYIEISNFWIDGNRTNFPEVDPDPGTANQLGHMLSIRNGSHQRISKMIISNWSRSTGIFLDTPTSHSVSDNWVDDCKLYGMNYAGNGILLVQQDSSGIRHCTVKDINNSAATVGEYVPTPCLGLQLKIECRNSVIEDCMAVGCRTGLKSAGDSAEGNTSCRFKNIGIIAATDVSPLNTLEGTPLTNIPVDIRSTRLSDFSGITIYGTGATSPLPASATAVYFDGTCNKLDFRVMDWLVPGSSILELGVDSDDNVIEFSQMNSLVSAGAISVPLTNDRNLIEVGALNNTGIAAAFPVGYVSDAGSGNVIRRKAA